MDDVRQENQSPRAAVLISDGCRLPRRVICMILTTIALTIAAATASPDIGSDDKDISLQDDRIAQVQRCLAVLESASVSITHNPTKIAEWSNRIGKEIYDIAKKVRQYDNSILRAAAVLYSSPAQEKLDLDIINRIFAIMNLVYEVPASAERISPHPMRYNYPHDLVPSVLVNKYPGENVIPAYWPWSFTDDTVTWVGGIMGYRGGGSYPICSIIMDISRYPRRDLDIDYVSR